MTPEEQQRLRQLMAQGVPEDIGQPDLGKTLDIVNRGYIGGFLGGFPDIANTALNAVVPGYNVETPVGGTEWWGQQQRNANRKTDGEINPNAEKESSTEHEQVSLNGGKAHHRPEYRYRLKDVSGVGYFNKPHQPLLSLFLV
jgi:hypothetical protein